VKMLLLHCMSLRLAHTTSSASLLGVKVTQFATAEIGACPGSFNDGSMTSPINLRLSSE